MNLSDLAGEKELEDSPFSEDLLSLDLRPWGGDLSTKSSLKSSLVALLQSPSVMCFLEGSSSGAGLNRMLAEGKGSLGEVGLLEEGAGVEVEGDQARHPDTRKCWHQEKN